MNYQKYIKFNFRNSKIVVFKPVIRKKIKNYNFVDCFSYIIKISKISNCESSRYFI